jgi:hypothetical protein
MRTTLLLLLTALVGCAATEFHVFEARENAFEGRGGTKTIVDGMEIWDTGGPPRKFKILGVIDDTRPSGPLPMSQLAATVVKRAKEAGGDAMVRLSSQSQITGYYSTGSATATANGNFASAYGSSIAMPVGRNYARFIVIKYLD